MPFCTKCGSQVRGTDLFCGSCGTKQESAKPAGSKASLNFDPRTATLLCYLPVVGWIPCIIVLASARFRHDQRVRFNAFQGLYLFVAWLLVDWVVAPFFRFGGEAVFTVPPVAGILKVVLICVWVYLLVKASHGETIRLPLIGELAERSLAERQQKA